MYVGADTNELLDLKAQAAKIGPPSFPPPPPPSESVPEPMYDSPFPRDGSLGRDAEGSLGSNSGEVERGGGSGGHLYPPSSSKAAHRRQQPKKSGSGPLPTGSSGGDVGEDEFTPGYDMVVLQPSKKKSASNSQTSAPSSGGNGGGWMPQPGYEAIPDFEVPVPAGLPESTEPSTTRKRGGPPLLPPPPPPPSSSSSASSSHVEGERWGSSGQDAMAGKRGGPPGLLASSSGGGGSEEQALIHGANSEPGKKMEGGGGGVIPPSLGPKPHSKLTFHSPEMVLMKDEHAKSSSTSAIKRHPHFYDPVDPDSEKKLGPTTPTRRPHIYESADEVTQHGSFQQHKVKKRTLPSNTTSASSGVLRSQQDRNQTGMDPVAELVSNPTSYLGTNLASKRLTVDLQCAADVNGEEREREREPIFLFKKGHSSSFIRVSSCVRQCLT